MTPAEQERLTELLHDDTAQRAQGRELVRTLIGPDPFAQARLYCQLGCLVEVALVLRETPIAIDPVQARLIACDLAETAMDHYATDVVPRPGRPARDPRCDEVIAGMRAFARGEVGEAERLRLTEVALAADQDDGWWETEAICAIVSADPLDALDGAARSLWILVHNIRRPLGAAAPPAIRDAVLALLDHAERAG